MGVFVYAMQLYCQLKQPNKKLKTRPKQFLGSIPLAFALLAPSKNVENKEKKQNNAG
jgi:hypothetical protein